MSGRRPATSAESGFLLIDKPEGPTSFDVVAKLRRITAERRIGHAGTLDPLASGLLIVAVGREATRNIGRLVGLSKEYEAVVRLGAVSETDDREGPVTPASDRKPHQREVEETLRSLTGVQEQVPPRFSAVKVAGKKAYDVARRGGSLELKPRKVEILQLSLEEYTYPLLRVTVHCSSGTYIRSLARDLGERLGTGAYLERLRRTKVGEYSVEDAEPLASFESGMNWTKNLLNISAEE